MMRCTTCGTMMTVAEHWDEAGCCAVSVRITLICPRCWSKIPGLAPAGSGQLAVQTSAPED